MSTEQSIRLLVVNPGQKVRASLERWIRQEELPCALEAVSSEEGTFGRTRDELEQRVEQRTAVLQIDNRELREEIAQRKAAEEALRKEKERYRILVETIPHGIEEVDAQGVRTFANAAFHQITGHPEGSLVGTHIWDVVAPESEQERLRKFFETLITEQPEPTPYFTQARSSNGKLTDIRVDWKYKLDDAGRVAGFVAVLTDVTAQHRAEEEARRHLDRLAHVERLSTMGEMVSGLAHELNQPLAAISNYARACCHRIRALEGEAGEAVLDSVEQIAEQADRAGGIIRHLREFVRRVDSSRSTVEVNELVRDVAVLLEIQMRSRHVHLELDLGRSLPKICVDRVQIEQVIVNLVHNAMDAVQDMPQERRQVTIRTATSVDGMLDVAVEDTGSGLKNEDLDRLFDPFYTTKTGGMGLGLSISRSIVEAHGGRLEAAPNTSSGATFRFVLPPKREGRPR